MIKVVKCISKNLFAYVFLAKANNFWLSTVILKLDHISVGPRKSEHALPKSSMLIIMACMK